MNNDRVRTVVLDPRIADVTSGMLERYATDRGWFRYPHPFTPFWQHKDFVFDDGTPILLTIPKDNRGGDLAQRAYEMIRQLSDLEARSEKQILDDLVALLPAPAANGRPRRKPAAKPRKKLPST